MTIPQKPLEWDGKLSPKHKPAQPTAVNDQGMPVVSLGAGTGSPLDLRRATKERQAGKNWRRLFIISCALIPVALGGVAGTLFFDCPAPSIATCIKAAVVAILLTAMVGGVIFSAVMFQLLKMSGGMGNLLGSLFLFELSGILWMSAPVDPRSRDQHESFDPILPATILAVLGTLVVMPFVAVVARIIAESQYAESMNFLPPLIGGLIGAACGAVLVVLGAYITKPAQT